MGLWVDLKTDIDGFIKANGNEDITGPLMNTVLDSIIDNIGFGSTYLGMAYVSTVPPTETDAGVFYLASENGTYSNFGTTSPSNGITVLDELAVIEKRGDSTWVKTTALDLSQLILLLNGSYGDLTDINLINTDGNVSLDSLVSSNLTCTRLNSRSFPWIYLTSSRYGYNLKTNSRYLILAASSTSVLALTIDETSNSGKVFRWLNNDTFSIIYAFTNHLIPINSLIEASRLANVIDISVDGVIKWSINMNDYNDSEWDNPVFGNIVPTDGVIVEQMKTSSYGLVDDVAKIKNDNALIIPRIDALNASVFTGFKIIETTAEIAHPDVIINSLDASGNLDLTRDNGRSFPWIYIDNAKYGVTHNNSSKYYIIGGDSSSVVAITIDSTISSGQIYRWVNNDTFALVDALVNIPIGATDNVRMTRFGDIVNVYANGTLLWEINTSGYSETEFSKPIFGNVISSNGVVINGLNIGSNNDNIGELDARVTALEGGASNINTYTSLGDSIEEYGTSQSILQAEFNIGSVQNTAVGGTTMISQGTNYAMAQFATISGSPNLITSNFGTNDFGKNLILGTNADTNPATSFYGALDAYCKALKTSYPSSKIFFYNIQHRDWLGGGQASGLINGNGDSVEDFNNAIEEMCRKYSISVIDLYQDWGVCKENITTYTLDRLHPNPAGFTRRSKSIISKIREIY